jgi:GNAT superfamily N-acetyltransferase
MHQESHFKTLDFDPDTLKELIAQFIQMQFVQIAIYNNQIIGVFIGFITEYYFGKDLYASDLTYYVDRTKRGSVAAVKLFKDFETWATKKGAKRLNPATSTGINPERTKKFYERMGYTVTGHTYNKEVNNG